MFSSKLMRSSALMLTLSLGFLAYSQEQTPGLGTPVSESALSDFDLIASPDGSGYPDGAGSVLEGKGLFERRCVACHGMNGEGTGGNTRLVGGDMRSSDAPIRTVGSYWPHASTLFDFIRRAMPADAPKSLSSNEVYQATAYILYMNGIIEEDITLSAAVLKEIEMPNAEGFIDHSTQH